MKKKTEPQVDHDARLIKEVEAAAKRWIGADINVEHMDFGRKFLAYLEGKATFVRVDDTGHLYEPPTCGTAHLTAERSLRIIENAVQLGESISREAIDAITQLSEDAGILFARQSIAFAPMADECPF